MPRRRFPGIWFFAVAILGGCAAPQPSSPSSRPASSSGAPFRIEATNLVTRSSPDGQVALNVEQFVAKAEQFQSAGKLGRLQRFVERFPDLALQMLRETSPQAARSPGRQAVAQTYDRLFVAARPDSGWSAILTAMAARPGEQQPQFQARMRVRSYIEQGRLDVAAKLEVDHAAALPPFLQADLLRLRGIAWFLDRKLDQALAAWQQGLALAESDAGAAAEFESLLCEAQRRLDRQAECLAAWDAAAERAIPLADPGFWQRLLELKPAGAAWPSTVEAHFRELAGAPREADATEKFEEGLIWSTLAEWRMARNEPVGALLAFAHAESTNTSARLKGEARIGQARALLSSGQHGPALSILASVVQAPEPSVARHALAVMGVANLQQGRSEEGISLLERALVKDEAQSWPGSSQAQVDLGLAYLAAGREDDGLRLLHDGQAAFHRQGQVADLCQCLANEAAYLQKKGRREQAQMLLDELTQIENQVTVPQ